MKSYTVKGFRDHATKVLRSEEPFFVTKRGQIAGIYFPSPFDSMPLELKKELFRVLTDSIREKLHVQGITEKEVLEDFEKHREAGR